MTDSFEAPRDADDVEEAVEETQEEDASSSDAQGSVSDVEASSVPVVDETEHDAPVYNPDGDVASEEHDAPIFNPDDIPTGEGS